MEEIIKTYAGNIRRARQNKKVTQAVMAEKIGITEKYWSDIETGRNTCSLDTLVAIANALEIEPYELFLPENKVANYDTRRAKIVMKQLKENFSEMVDTLGHFFGRVKLSVLKRSIVFAIYKNKTNSVYLW